MSDLIKREDAIKVVDSYIGTDPIVEELKKVPPAEPKQEWTPCSERLPSDEEDVIAWVESGDVARIACCNYANEVWFDVIMNVKVSPIAWMPCPEPYKRSR